MKLPIILLNTTFAVFIAAWFGSLLPRASSFSFGHAANTLKKENADFQAFIKLFPARDLPYKLGASELNGWIERSKQKANKNAPMAKQAAVASISESYGEFIPSLNAGRFSRMGPDVFRPEAMLATSDKNVAVIYSRGRGYSRNYASYYLATYSARGKRIDETFVGGSKGYKSFTGCTITKAQNGSLLVTVQEYENKWKEDGNYYSDDNHIMASTVKSSVYKLVSANGAIASVDMP
jgi:hypothetical protein